MELIIGNKNYSSWSLRGWMMLKAFNLLFKETRLPLFIEDFYALISEYHAADKAPVLIDDGVTIWDSLAICEYVNERYLAGKGWPSGRADRALARAISNEMHSGFFAVRNEMPMNCRAKRRVELSAQALREISRIDFLWSSNTKTHADKGPWLFGEFSIADVMYAPVVLRFRTYGIEVSAQSQGYCKVVLNHSAMRLWLKEALLETEVVKEDQAGEEIE